MRRVATTAIAHTVSRQSIHAPPQRHVAAWHVSLPFFVVTVIFFALNPMIRLAGGVLYVAYIACAAVFVFSMLLTRGLWVFSQMTAMRYLFGLSALGTLYLGLSYLNLLPNAWTVFYDRSVIPQQASFVYALALLVMASYALFRGILSDKKNATFFFVLCLVFPIYRAIALGVGDGLDLRLNTFSNPMLPAYLALGHLVFVTYARSSRMSATILGLLCAIPTNFLQNAIGGIYMAAIGFTRRPRLILFGLILSAVAVSVIGQWYSEEVWRRSPDTGVRLWMMHDGVQGLIQSYGMGVGFGKESLKNYFQLSATIQFIDMKNGVTNFLVVGIHNAVVQMFYRLGLAGGLLFVAFITACNPLDVRHVGLRNSATFAYGIAFLTIWSNPCIESQAYHAGLALAFGYILACKAVALSDPRYR